MTSITGDHRRLVVDAVETLRTILPHLFTFVLIYTRFLRCMDSWLVDISGFSIHTLIVAHATHTYCGWSKAAGIFVCENIMWTELGVSHFLRFVTQRKLLLVASSLTIALLILPKHSPL